MRVTLPLALLVASVVLASTLPGAAARKSERAEAPDEVASIYGPNAWIVIEHLGLTDRVVYTRVLRAPGSPVPVSYLADDIHRVDDVSGPNISAILTDLESAGFFLAPHDVDVLEEQGSYRFTIKEGALVDHQVDLNRFSSEPMLQAIHPHLLAHPPALAAINYLILLATQ
ncbi:MAG: hypothetical protein DHS20C21_22120 [Gemmatimonadota bacterium]|nr:MAG: hypothetical protein DHS20C21_22120 [Gemmatimonadota bacterium]